MVHFEYLMLVIHVRTYECWVEFLIIFFYFWLVQQRPLMDHDDVNKNIKKIHYTYKQFFFRF